MNIGHAAPSPKFESGAGFLLARVGALSARSWTDMLAEVGISPHEYGALMVLHEQGPTSQTFLARALAVDPRNLGPIIDRLQSTHLARRVPAPDDRRRRVVELTTEGAEVATSVLQRSALISQDFFSSLDPNELAQLTEILRKLYTAKTC